MREIVLPELLAASLKYKLAALLQVSKQDFCKPIRNSLL